MTTVIPFLISEVAEFYLTLRRGHVGTDQQAVVDKIAANLGSVLGIAPAQLTDSEINAALTAFIVSEVPPIVAASKKEKK